MEAATTDQIKDLSSLDSHQAKLESLRQRVKVGRDTVETLGARLQKVRNMVEEWERKEKEWQAMIKSMLPEGPQSVLSLT